MDAAAGATARNSALSFGVLDREREDRALSARLDAELAPAPGLRVRAGAEGARLRATESGTVPAGGVLAPGAPARPVEDGTRRATHAGGYLEAEARPRASVAVTIGARADRLPGESGWTADPRLAVGWRLSDWTFRLAAGVYHQGRWRTRYRLPEGGEPAGVARRARHLVAGLERGGAFPVRVEAFLKVYDRYVAEPGAAATAGLACPHVDVHLRPALEAESIRAADAGQQQVARRLDELQQLLVAQVPDAGPWILAAAEERFVLPNVADPGHHPLVHERVADGKVGAERVAEPHERLGRIELLRKEVRAEAGERPVGRERARFEQLDYGRAEVHDDGVVDFENQAGLPLGAGPRLARPVDVPGPVHPQVAPEREPVIELDHEVLPDGPGTQAGRTDQPLDLRNRPRTVRSRGADDLAGQSAVHPAREPVEGVTLGHRPWSPGKRCGA